MTKHAGRRHSPPKKPEAPAKRKSGSRKCGGKKSGRVARPALLLFGDDGLDRGDDSRNLDFDHVGADLVDRLLEADLAAVDP